MLFDTKGEKGNPVVLFFHAMGVTGRSSERVAGFLKRKYFCVMPTSSVYCEGQRYVSKSEEVRQTEEFLRKSGVKEIALVVASSIGADLCVSFLRQTKIPVRHVFFDGGQFAQIGKFTRRIMTPFLYFAMKSVNKKKGENLGKIMWCDDEEIRPYFVQAGKNLKYGNLRRQMADSLENKPFSPFDEETQKHMFFGFGSAEEHFKYRENVMKAYPYANFPVFKGYNRMQYQIRDPEGFADMLISVAEKNEIPELPFSVTG